MTLSQQFSKARHPDRWRILGRRLGPFTVGRFDLIQNLDRSSATDFIAAILICSRPYKKAKNCRLSLFDALWAIFALWAMNIRPELFDTAFDQFRLYLDEGNKEPNFWKKPSETRTSSCPEVLSLLHDLGDRYTDEQIMEMPLAEARWRVLAPVEKGGGIEFIEDDIIAEAKAMALQVAEEEAAKNGVR